MNGGYFIFDFLKITGEVTNRVGIYKNIYSTLKKIKKPIVICNISEKMPGDYPEYEYPIFISHIYNGWDSEGDYIRMEGFGNDVYVYEDNTVKFN